MNLLALLIGSLVVFAISFTLLYKANFSQDKRYKQLWFPLVALLISLAFLLFDEMLTRFYGKFLKEQMPSLISYTSLLINLSFLVAFLIVKSCWRMARSLSFQSLGNNSKTYRWLRWIDTLPKKAASIFNTDIHVNRTKTELFEPGTVSLVYMKIRGQILLKKEWTYLSWLFKYSSIFPIVLLVLLMITSVYHLSFIQYLPKYPIISIVLLLEIAWFLNGRKVAYSEGLIDGQDAISTRLATYEELYNQYKELWGDRLLADGNISENKLLPHRTNHFSYENLSLEREHQLIINAICDRLKKRNLIIDESYTTMMLEMIQDHDVLIEDVIYEDFSSYFFPALYHLLTKNKKILIIAHSKYAAEEAVEWVMNGISEESGLDQVWKVSTFLDALEQNTNPDILIVSPDILQKNRFLQYLSQLEKTKILEGIILLQAEKLIPTYSTIVHAFNLNVRELIGKKPQYIILTEWYEGLEHTIRSVLQCEPRDIVASSNMSQNLHFMVWKKEGEKWFQHTLLPKMSHRQLEAEVVLTLPALKENIEPVHFINQRETTVKESIQEIMDMKAALFELGFDLETLDQFLKRMQIHDRNLSIPVEDFSFLLIRDDKHNLVDSLNLWKGAGKMASFVHIVSPPYLIRDYLANQLEFYRSTNRTIAPLAPRLSQSVWSIAYYLLERLCHFFINEEEVVSYLGRAKINTYRSVVEGVHELFSKAFGPKLAYRLKIESKELLKFDRSKKDFVKQTQFRIPYTTKEKILPKGFRFIEIKHNNMCISEIFEGHIYQQYLPGQFHSFNGELYKIQKVDLEHGVMEVSFEPLYENKYYRPRMEFRISQLAEEDCFEKKTISFERLEVSVGELQADVKIHTSGYVELSQLLNLKSMRVHTFHQEEEITRQYENGHFLRMEICSKQGTIQNAARIEFTLALLLNELFVSFFPETHHFVKACARLDESFFDQSEPMSKKLHLITPSIQMAGEAIGEGQITLFMIEDSPVHLGILEAIRDNWEKIFDILNDYLFWLLNESNGHSDYLHFGYDRYPTELALRETYLLIDELLTRKKLREVRTEYLGLLKVGDTMKMSGSETQCVFCGNVFSSTQVHQLDDGRKRCFTCNETAIDRVSQVEPLYNQVRQFFNEVYLVPLPADIELSLLSTAEIHSMSGLPFIPEAGHPRLTGKASMDVYGKLKLIVENGSPKIYTLSTLAHELTHIWQYENLDVEKLTVEELEGFASWVEVHMMTQMGEIPYANMLKQQLLNRQDEYGTGYRLIVEKLSRQSKTATPFELFVAEEVGM
ncbi:hypothetical protein ABES02_16520 [Neobacillus pocheonensis]|uniref:hypothetical protein n=1 Tax=Neobacillus pocheonensis TaxID=363869 RepID=UPI003D2DCDFD